MQCCKGGDPRQRQQQQDNQMLSSANSGKYLYGKYARQRAAAVGDKTPFTEDEQDYLDISGTEGTAVHQDKTYEIDTQPVDSNPLKQSQPQKEKIDIRKLPQMGG